MILKFDKTDKAQENWSMLAQAEICTRAPIQFLIALNICL